jgi:hypothetical protein
VTTAGSNYDTVLAVYTANSITGLIVNNDDVDLGNVTTSSVTFPATAGTVYKIAVDGYANSSAGDRGNIVLNWAQSGCTQAPPVLITEAGTSRAVALDAVTQVRGSFRIAGLFNFSADRHTRVMLFTSDLGGAAVGDLSVQVHGVALPVEGVGQVPGLSQASYVIVRLIDQSPVGNDLPLSITLRGVASNTATISIAP